MSWGSSMKDTVSKKEFENRPHVIIGLGVQKAGTSAFWNVLKTASPNVIASTKGKELNYFFQAAPKQNACSGTADHHNVSLRMHVTVS